MRILLVADPGGHLAVLHWLRPALARHELRWATVCHPHAKQLLGNDDAVFGFGPTHRSVTALARNGWMAARAVRRWRPDVVISAGAAFGVPWLAAGKALGAKSVFIEVVDRQAEPSLSGRLVRRWVDEVWLQDPLQRQAYPRGWWMGALLPPSRPQQPRVDEVFVAFGTHAAPFKRLVAACEALARSGERVVVQHGHSPKPRGCEGAAWFDAETYLHHLDTARVVVLHGGSSSAAEARSGGRTPVVVAREARHGEHVDDHQFSPHAVSPEDLVRAVCQHVEGASTSLESDALQRVADRLATYSASV